MSGLTGSPRYTFRPWPWMMVAFAVVMSRFLVFDLPDIRPPIGAGLFTSKTTAFSQAVAAEKGLLSCSILAKAGHFEYPLGLICVPRVVFEVTEASQLFETFLLARMFDLSPLASRFQPLGCVVRDDELQNGRFEKAGLQKDLEHRTVHVAANRQAA